MSVNMELSKEMMRIGMNPKLSAAMNTSMQKLGPGGGF